MGPGELSRTSESCTTSVEPIETIPVEKPKLTNIQKIQLIQQTINEQVRPALRAHGGNIELVDVDGDNVSVAFRGMCAQCPSSEFTMQGVVESKLREYVSEDLMVIESKEHSAE